MFNRQIELLKCLLNIFSNQNKSNPNNFHWQDTEEYIIKFKK